MFSALGWLGWKNRGSGPIVLTFNFDEGVSPGSIGSIVVTCFTAKDFGIQVRDIFRPPQGIGDLFDPLFLFLIP